MKNRRPFLHTSFKQALLDHAAKVWGSSNHCSKAWVAAGVLLLPGLAFGQSVTATGDVTPSPAESPVWNIGGDLFVGYVSGGEGTLTILDGGKVSNTHAYIGQPWAPGTVTVSGEHSTWAASGVIVVGLASLSNGYIQVENGGSVTAMALVMGEMSSTQSGGTVTVWGSDATLDVTSGDSGSHYFRNPSGAGGWLLSGALYVGRSGYGALEIVYGRVSSEHGFIGSNSGSDDFTGSNVGRGVAFVGGEGALWDISGDLILATDSGGSGDLTIWYGGTVNVGGTTRVHANGTVEISDGGTLRTHHLDATNGTFKFVDGTLIVNGTITGNLAVPEFGTLGGNAITGDLSVSGLLLSSSLPSETGAGTITVGGDLTLDSTAYTLLGLSGFSEFDRIDVSGELAFGGTLALGFLDDFAPQVNDTFELFTGNYTWVEGTFFERILFSAPGYEGIFDYGTGTLTITAIPEPSTYGLLIASAALFAAVRRRYRGSQTTRTRADECAALFSLNCRQ